MKQKSRFEKEIGQQPWLNQTLGKTMVERDS